MKFDFCIGNPPYQEGKLQIYPSFFESGKQIANTVEMIFPTGWQAPKIANGLKILNNENVKADCQIVFIDNRQNAFPNVSGAEWTNIILWKSGYDNGLNGKQAVYTEGRDLKSKKLLWETEEIEKPEKLIEMKNIVLSASDFQSFAQLVSTKNPFGIPTDFFAKQRMNQTVPIYDVRNNDKNICVFGKLEKRDSVKYLDETYLIPKNSNWLTKYKVFVPYIWGNLSNSGIGGAYADIKIAHPYHLCTETYIVAGLFDAFETAQKHAKYLLSKFLRGLLFVNKFSIANSSSSYAFIPVQNYSEPWWNMSICEIDEYLFAKYNIPEDVADFVRKNIQTKTEQNIVDLQEEYNGN